MKGGGSHKAESSIPGSNEGICIPPPVGGGDGVKKE